MDAQIIKRGDAFSLPIFLEDDSGQEITDESDISKIEFCVGRLIKLYPQDVQYNVEFGAFLFPLTQEETFAFKGATVAFDCRVKFSNGDVLGIEKIQYIQIAPSVSNEVL